MSCYCPLIISYIQLSRSHLPTLNCDYSIASLPLLSPSLSPLSPVISSAPLVAPVSIVHVQVKFVELNYPANIFAMMFEMRIKAKTTLRKDQLINGVLHLTALNTNV